MVNLSGRNLLKEIDLTREEFLHLVELGARLRNDKRNGSERPRLSGRNIALIFEKTSTRTMSAFEVAAHDQGAHVTYLGPGGSQIGYKESMKDTARVLGRMFDGVENGLTDEWHPTQMLADVLTMRDHATRPLEEVAYCYLGDGRNNTANSLLVTGALLGMDVRIAAPETLWPSSEVQSIAQGLASRSGARITVSADLPHAVRDADFIYTDVWLSMGEPVEEWDDRIDELLPYQVSRGVMDASGNPDVKFMHCLPAFHDTKTEVGLGIFEKRGLSALEVTDEVFESPASIVFDQAENRLHTIKALMVATLGGG